MREGRPVPPATDIALAMGVLALLGRGLPPALRAKLRDAAVRGCDFSFLGGSAVALWGDTDEWDGRGGDQPRWTTLERHAS